MAELYKKIIEKIVEIFLFALATLIIIYIGRDLVDIFKVITSFESQGSLAEVSDFILGFFMLFEFIVMIMKYIENTHNIPIKYMVIISITAILRQLLVVHDDGLQTLYLTISILVLAGVLYVLELIKTKEKNRSKEK